MRRFTEISALPETRTILFIISLLVLSWSSLCQAPTTFTVYYLWAAIIALLIVISLREQNRKEQSGDEIITENEKGDHV